MTDMRTNTEGNSGVEDLFGPPISVYTDAQAIEDGFLADLGRHAVRFLGFPVNRITSNLFDDLKPFAEAESKLLEGDFDKALGSILRTKCQFAQGSEGNTGEIGDIYKIPPNLWLVRNGEGGWTAMYPEDY